jgi:hypothetical protein
MQVYRVRMLLLQLPFATTKAVCSFQWQQLSPLKGSQAVFRKQLDLNRFPSNAGP